MPGAGGGRNIALSVRAAEAAQQAKLAFAFNSFGNRAHPSACARLTMTRTISKLSDLHVHARDEGAVDVGLASGRRGSSESADWPVPKSSMASETPSATTSCRMRWPASRFSTTVEFGEFGFEMARIEPGIGEHAPHESGNVVPQSRSGAQKGSHGDEFGGARPVAVAPCLHLGAGAAEYPLADLHDQARLLRDRDQDGRRHGGRAVAVPAQQRLDAPQASALQVDDGLVDELELAALQRLAQGKLDLQQAERLAVLGRLEQLDPSAADALGAVHRHVGVRQQHLGSTVVVRRGKGEAQRGFDQQGAASQREGGREGAERAFGEDDGFGLARGVVDEDAELVAAQARHRHTGAKFVGKPCGDRREKLVACRIAQQIVDELKSVEADADDRDFAGCGARAAPCKRMFDLLEEQRAGRQAGEAIAQRAVDELAFGTRFVGDIWIDTTWQPSPTPAIGLTESVAGNARPSSASA